MNDVTVSFDDDPRASEYVEIACGKDWARIKVYGVSERWDHLARTAVALLRATPLYFTVWPPGTIVTTNNAADQERGQQAWSAATATAITGTRPPNVEGRLRRTAPHTHMNHAREKIDPLLVQAVISKVSAYARQYGSTPDFTSNVPKTRTSVYNYIRSVYGQPLSDAVLEAVRAHFAQSKV